MTDDELAHYSAALDEVYALRAILAGEALRVEADLSLKSFPKSRRGFAEEAAERLRAAARGDYWPAYHHLKRPKMYLRECGARETLTRSSWEDDRTVSSESAFEEHCERCQHDGHVCPGCGTAQDHAGRDRQEHDPTCVALEPSR